MVKKTEKEGVARPVPVGRPDDTHFERVADQSDNMLHLKQHIDRLKMGVGVNQVECRRLRDQLRNTKKNRTPKESFPYRNHQ
ncbi:MAG: hypothetical protein SV375_20000 [Thermodesulfobacteriota bacterium]|nr:hypothetical protein [Thermodesulfobacteriota bacterium]